MFLRRNGRPTPTSDTQSEPFELTSFLGSWRDIAVFEAMALISLEKLCPQMHGWSLPQARSPGDDMEL